MTTDLKQPLNRKIKVVHVITSLLMGGAEKVLLRLLQNMDTDQFDNEVIALTVVGPLADGFKEAGVPVMEIGFVKGNNNLSAISRLSRALRNSDADIVQTWLYHADLLGGGCARVVTRADVLWNLRQSKLDPNYSSRSTRVISRLCAMLSSVIPKNIVCGSYAAAQVHGAMGYDKRKFVIIENGFDTNVYQRSEAMRAAFRKQHGISGDTMLIGHAARLDPQKDHATFIHAAEKVLERYGDVKFVLCGSGTEELPQNLFNREKFEKFHDSFLLLGIQEDMVSFYSAMDILIMSSAYGEGAPNVLGEAMSCSVPCIATDIGDSAHLIGETGMIVPPRNSDELANAMFKMIEEPQDEREKRKKAARSRIVENFSLEKMINGYQQEYLYIFSERSR